MKAVLDMCCFAEVQKPGLCDPFGFLRVLIMLFIIKLGYMYLYQYPVGLYKILKKPLRHCS